MNDQSCGLTGQKQCASVLFSTFSGVTLIQTNCVIYVYKVTTHTCMAESEQSVRSPVSYMDIIHGAVLL